MKKWYLVESTSVAERAFAYGTEEEARAALERALQEFPDGQSSLWVCDEEQCPDHLKR